MTKPTFSAIRATAAAQAEIAWWSGASPKSIRARIFTGWSPSAAHQLWCGNATIRSEAPGPTRVIRGGGSTWQTQAGWHVRGLDPTQVVDAKAVAAMAGCTEYGAVQALRPLLQPHLDRVRAAIDKQLSDPQQRRVAEEAWRAKRDKQAKRNLVKRVAEFREHRLPHLIKGGLTEDEWVSWYRLALVADVHES